jgi:hypothetical protein
MTESRAKGTAMAVDLTGGYPVEYEASVVTPPGDDPWFGENYALWLWDEERSTGIHLYLKTLGHLGSYALRRETINVHLPDGTILMSESDGPGNIDPSTPRGPNLEMHCSKPFEEWRYTFDATAQPTTALEMRDGLLRHMPLVPLAFDIQGTTKAPPALTGTFTDDARTEWARTFFGGRRYEQCLTGEGTIRTSEGEIPFSGVGMRTHRVGTRNLGEFPGHTWMIGLFPSGRAFCVQRMLDGNGVVHWEEGWVSDGAGGLHPAHAHEMTPFSWELPGERLVIDLESPLGRSPVEGTLRVTNFTTLMPADRLRFCWGTDVSDERHLIMPQGLAVYEWDGEIGAGMIERSVHVGQMPPHPVL